MVKLDWSTPAFGTSVRRIRRSLKMDLVELSDKTGIRLSRLSSIEHNEPVTAQERDALLAWMRGIVAAEKYWQERIMPALDPVARRKRA